MTHPFGNIANSLTSWNPVPGSRFAFGWNEFENIGTIGAIGFLKGKVFLITAGHVVRSIYNGVTRYGGIAGKSFVVGVNEGFKITYTMELGRTIQPDNPRTFDDMFVDAVAIPLPPDVPLPKTVPGYQIPDSLELFEFKGERAFVLVERNGKPFKIRGQIEDVFFPRTEVIDGMSLNIPQTIMLRFFGGDTTEEGDSGAPILAMKDNNLHLLGIHFIEGDRDEQEIDFRTYSLGTASSVVFAHTKMELHNPEA